MGKAMDAEVMPVAVVEMKRNLPLDATGLPEAATAQYLLDKADAQARAAGCSVKSTLVTARAIGPAVVDEISERLADVAIIGVPYDRRLGEFQLGEAAEYILRHAPCQVWLVREAAIEIEGIRSGDNDGTGGPSCS